MSHLEITQKVRKVVAFIAWICLVIALFYGLTSFLLTPARDFGYRAALEDLFLLKTVPSFVMLSVVCQWIARGPVSKVGHVIFWALLLLALIPAFMAANALAHPTFGTFRALGFEAWLD